MVSSATSAGLAGRFSAPSVFRMRQNIGVSVPWRSCQSNAARALLTASAVSHAAGAGSDPAPPSSVSSAAFSVHLSASTIGCHPAHALPLLNVSTSVAVMVSSATSAGLAGRFSAPSVFRMRQNIGVSVPWRSCQSNAARALLTASAVSHAAGAGSLSARASAGNRASSRNAPESNATKANSAHRRLRAITALRGGTTSVSGSLHLGTLVTRVRSVILEDALTQVNVLEIPVAQAAAQRHPELTAAAVAVLRSLRGGGRRRDRW